MIVYSKLGACASEIAMAMSLELPLQQRPRNSRLSEVRIWVLKQQGLPHGLLWPLQHLVSGDGGYGVCGGFKLGALAQFSQAPAAGSSGKISRKEERQELLWEDFFLDPTKWWDNRPDKRSPRHPDFRHKATKEPLWLNSPKKPGWVDDELARWDAGLEGHYAGTEDGSGDSMLRMLRRTCEEGDLGEAVGALELLLQRGFPICQSLFYPVLKRCMAEEGLLFGRRVHALAVGSGYDLHPFVANHIIGMYAYHGELEEAAQVFHKLPSPDVYMWATMVFARVNHGQPVEAVKLYQEMRDTNVKADNRIFVAVLKACASAVDLAAGRQVHQDIVKSDLTADIFVGSSLVNMYAKCGSLDEAREVFDRLATRDVVTWTTMIAGYTQQERGREAMALFAKMQEDGIIVADKVSLACLLQACARVGALQQGKQLHAQIEKRGLEDDVLLGSALVDMYAKCGSLDEARSVLKRLSTRDVVTWNALLNGYAEHGDGDLAMQCFDDMIRQGVQPDETTFISLLVACSHAGLVQEGQRYFGVMADEYGIVPTAYHYSCMVDLLGRSGCLDEAENLMRTPSFEKNPVGWKALLSACKNYGDLERGRRCFDRLVELEPESASSYVLLGNIYANAGLWGDVDRLEKLRKSAGAMKKPAKACIEVKNEVHEFTVGEDRSDIYGKLKSVNTRLKEEGGHVPHTQLVLKAVSEQEKEDSLCGHAEKLALAYGLMNTPDGTTLIVTKNLRMCNDCHSSTKIMSHLEKREIVVRDAHRVHRFVDGSCSCGDRH